MFKKSRPHVRQYQHETDKGYLWAAYKQGTFGFPEGLSQEEFLVNVIQMLSRFPVILVIEDDHPGFKSGRGLVGVIGVKTDGWVLLPEVLFFKWARPRNILRASVAFFQLVRHQKIGVCEVRTTKKDFPYMKHMEKYGVLYVRGKIPNGSAQGDVWIFSINGKRE